MDLREKRTIRSIKNAFIELRSKKPLERIRVKELAELAEINKATFYLHYKDIYDLSDQLQKEVIENILNDISRPDLILSDVKQFTRELFASFYSQEPLIDILFSDSQASVLPLNIETELRKYIFERLPEAKDNIRFNVLLTHSIQGGYFAYQKYHKQIPLNDLIEILNERAELKLL